MSMTTSSLPLKPMRHEKAANSLFGHQAIAAAFALAGIGTFTWDQIQHLGTVLGFNFPNPDDAMRLIMVRDFIAGQSWFDTTQYRFLPPEGLSMHWSRLLDLPLAGAIAALRPLVGLTLAEGIVIAAWPPFLFALYLGVVAHLLWRMVDFAAVGFAFFIAAQMYVLRFLFGAGRIDHHNVEALLVAAATTCFILSNRSTRAAIFGGLASALALAVSLESLPFIGCIGSLYVLAWVFDDERSGEALFAFFVTLSGGAVFLHGVQTPPFHWLEAKCDALSTPWLLLVCGGGVIALAFSCAREHLRTWKRRLAAAVLVGAILLMTFTLIYPACLHGPYAAIPEPFRTILLDDIPESRSFWRLMQTRMPLAFETLGPIVVAASIATIALLKRDTAWRMPAALALLSWTAVALSLIEIRGVYIGSVFVPIVGGWALHRAVTERNDYRPVIGRTAALLGASFFLFGLPWAAASSLAQSDSVAVNTEYIKTDECDGSLAKLDKLPKGNILAPSDLDISILFHTHHSVTTTGYHRGVAGIIAAIESFSGSEDDMRRHAQQGHADYVVLCAPWVTSDPARSTSFARALAQGRSVSWLEPIKLEAEPLMIWRVRL